MYSREKLTIKGRASRRVFPSKNALQTKRPVFYSPGEFTGRGSETHLHKRKVEILRFRAKRELSSNLPPKRKNRPEDRSAENFENGGKFWGFSKLFAPPENGEFFKSQKESKFIFLKNSPRAPLKSMQRCHLASGKESPMISYTPRHLSETISLTLLRPYSFKKHRKLLQDPYLPGGLP